MMKKRITALLLSLCLIATVFVFPSANANTEDSLLYRTTGCPEDTVAFTLNGIEYSMEYCLYWLTYILDFYDSYGYIIDFEADMNGINTADYFKQDAFEVALMYAVIEQKADELKLALDSATMAEIKENLSDYASYLGDYYPYWMKSAFVTEESLLKLEQSMYASEMLYDYYYGENGIELPDSKTLIAVAEETGWMTSKHILLSTCYDDGTSFSPAEKVAVLEEATDLRSYLASKGDGEALFDTLMYEYSEDPGFITYPNGYTFGPNTMVIEFENGTKALNEYEISHPIESQYGYHIIMRFPLDEGNESFREDVLKNLWDAKLDQWIETASPQISAAWDALDVADFNEKRNAALDEYDALYAAIVSGNTPSDWAQEQVSAAITAGLVPEALQTKYTNSITRAEFCALAVTLYETVTGEEITGRIAFTDTNDTNVEKTAFIEVVNGTAPGLFSPNDPLTREQAATILIRLSAALGRSFPSQEPQFDDNGNISDWAYQAVGKAQNAGLMNGDGSSFHPADFYSKEQSILTLYRLYKIIKSQS